MTEIPRAFKKMPFPTAEIDGVASGLAYGLGVPTFLVRSLFIVTAIFLSGSGLMMYFILSMCMSTWDEVPKDYKEITSS